MHGSGWSRLDRAALAAAASGALLLAQGCVTRSITVISTPPGADAYLDDEYMGKTPATVSFKHYGTRRVRVEKEGFQTTSRRVEMRPPWYQIFPLDLICEVLIPYNFRDRRTVSVELEPPDVDKKGFLEKARRERATLSADGNRTLEAGH